MSIENRLEELGITLPEPPAPVAAYVPTVQTGNLVFVSGQGPVADGKLAYIGRLGAELRASEDQEAQRHELHAQDPEDPALHEHPAEAERAVHDLDGVQLVAPSDLVGVDVPDLQIEQIPELLEGLVGRAIQAQDEVAFLVFSFTDDDLAQAMIDAFNSGVSVSGVFDESQARSNIGGEYDHLLENGVDVRLDGNPKSMHHKVIIIDDQILITGSYNFSQSAKTRNDENTLIIHSPEIAEIYRQEFERVWEIAKD